jgi:hypothetical protein
LKPRDPNPQPMFFTMREKAERLLS